MSRLMIAFGTRPEWIKVKPLIDEFMNHGEVPVLLYVKQHEDIDLGARRPLTINVQGGENRLDAVLYSIISTGLWERNKDITHVLVQGDTATAMGVALSAFNHKKKVIHLEAGLRTYDNDNPWPEESYRRIISSIADIHLCPTLDDAHNLFTENANGNVFVTGNTSIDSLISLKKDCEYTNKVLVTMHRRENHSKMEVWFRSINFLATSYPELEFILPLHWSPYVRAHKDVLEHVTVVEPMSHEDLLRLLIKTKMVITDSGGIQEECSFFNKKCLVCRKETERKASLSKSSFLVPFPSMLPSVFAKHVDNYEIDYPCPYGEGNSSKIIYDILQKILDT